MHSLQIIGYTNIFTKTSKRFNKHLTNCPYYYRTSVRRIGYPMSVVYVEFEEVWYQIWDGSCLSTNNNSLKPNLGISINVFSFVNGIMCR